MFSKIESLLKLSPYSLNKEEKANLFNELLQKITNHHYQNCNEYKNIIDAVGLTLNSNIDFHNIPFLPVGLFKSLNLKSITDQEIFKFLTSSGTTGQTVSKIYLDKQSVFYQQKVLTKIVTSFIDNSRMPMIIIDCPSVVKDRTKFSARGAGILGFSIFGYDRIFALNDDMEINFSLLDSFLEKHKDKRIFMFGFTFMVWQHFYQEIKKNNKNYDLSNCILIHGGGWKKLISESVTPDEFRKQLNSICHLNKIYDYYGMVEQTGTIYMECEQQHLHCSNFSDIIIRNPNNFEECQINEQGIIQTISILPWSYPGHSLLTEDEGVLLGEDDCPCGRKGKYFKVVGRIINAEIRGCSDTYASKF